jgi:uncharacterized damage-inducible protein DinB
LSKKQLIKEVRDARAAFMAAIEGLTDTEMMQPGAAGIWSVKDIMAHLVAWEAELVTALSRKLSKKYKDAPNIVRIEEVDEWNAEQYHENAARSLDIVRQDFQGVHKHLLLAIEDLDERLLNDPLRFEWMEGEPLSYLIVETAVWHEQDHAEDIQNWRESRQDSDPT